MTPYFFYTHILYVLRLYYLSITNFVDNNLYIVKLKGLIQQDRDINSNNETINKKYKIGRPTT